MRPTGNDGSKNGGYLQGSACELGTTLQGNVGALEGIADLLNIPGERFALRFLFLGDFLGLDDSCLGFHLALKWQACVLHLAIEFKQTALEGCQVNGLLAILRIGLSDMHQRTVPEGEVLS